MAKQGPSTQQRAQQGVVWLIFFRLLLAVIAIAVILVGAVAQSEGWPAAQEERAVYFIFVFIFLLTLFYLFAMRWIRNYYRYADHLFAARLNLNSYTELNPRRFDFSLYASGEYTQMLEREWEED